MTETPDVIEVKFYKTTQKKFPPNTVDLTTNKEGTCRTITVHVIDPSNVKEKGMFNDVDGTLVKRSSD